MARDDTLLQQIWDKVKNLDAVEQKIDGLSTRFDSLSTKVSSLESTVNQHTSDIAEIRAELAASRAEVKVLKTSHHLREQRLRSSTVRLFNYPYFVGESLDNFKGLTTKIYERIIRPTLVAAKAAGDVGSVQQQQNVIEACFRIYPASEGGASSTPPASPIIIRLANSSVKQSVMKHRKAIPAPSDNEREAGCRRFVLVEDLTPEAYGLLRALQQDARTEKVWSTNGHIFYTRPGVPGYKKVRNIFDDIETILA